MSEEQLESVLEAQSRRFVRALGAEAAVDADPIRHDDERLGSEARVTVWYELHHVILPALADDGIVEFDRHAGAVHRGPRFDDRQPPAEVED